MEYFPQTISTSSYPNVVVPVDFNNQIKEIIMSFHGLIDPIQVPVVFVPVDRKIYDEKVAKKI